MDSVYSIALLVSLASGIAALAVAVLVKTGRAPRPRAAGIVPPACYVAWSSLAISFGVHLVWGHMPGSSNALPPMAFLSEHIAFVPAALVPVVARVVHGPLSNRSIS